MYIHIQKLAIHLEVQHRKRILMQHHKVFVRILNTFWDQTAFDIAPVDEIIFKIPVSAGDHRFSDKTMDSYLFISAMDFHKRSRDIPSVNMVDDLFDISVSGGLEFRLIIGYEFKRYIRMRKRHMFHQAADIRPLRLRGF